jgi:diguanylate cyclase (GGDEF)-like protein
MSELGLQLALMSLEAVLAASALLVLFRVRSVLGLGPIYATVGVFYYLATLLAGTTFVKVGGLLMSPGSVALFPASLFAVLFVYIREDAKEARNLIYALLAANVVASLLGLVVARHLVSPLAFNPLSLSPDLFAQQPRLFIVGTLALYADTILIILAYEMVSRYLYPLFLRIYVSLALVLAFDTFLFVTGGFVEHPAYGEILLSGVLGKVAAALLYAVVLTVYLSKWDTAAADAPAGTRHDIRDLFQVLTYRQKYEALRAQATRDPLTGVHNRGFFDDVLGSQLAAAKRSGTPVALMMIDVDNFKRINDRYGHAEGDRVLRTVAQALAASVRAADIVCRYGGEEFCIILPGSPLASAAPLAERVLEEVPKACAAAGGVSEERITVTIGVAACPEDSEELDQLIRVADQRLYRGKDDGRNRVVAA